MKQIITAALFMAIAVSGAVGQTPTATTPEARQNASHVQAGGNDKLSGAETRLASVQQQGTQLRAEQKSLDQESAVSFMALQNLSEFRSYVSTQQKIADLNQRIAAFNQQLTAVQAEVDNLKKAQAETKPAK